jgi:hypothetical protein
MEAGHVFARAHNVVHNQPSVIAGSHHCPAMSSSLFAVAVMLSFPQFQ